MKDIKVVVEKMTRNRRKMIGKTADSLLCPLHTIQCLPLVFLPLWFATETETDLLYLHVKCVNLLFFRSCYIFYESKKIRYEITLIHDYAVY